MSMEKRSQETFSHSETLNLISAEQAALNAIYEFNCAKRELESSLESLENRISVSPNADTHIIRNANQTLEQGREISS